MPDDPLLRPDDALLMLVDYQPEMLDAVASADRTVLLNNVVALAETAKVFGLPVVLTTVGVTHGNGAMFERLRDVYPDHPVIDRTTMNAWEDPRVVAAVEATGRRRILAAGLWTEVCLAFPALYALADGYDVYPVSDASAGTSIDAHERAMERMVQAGAHPVTWLAVLCELQRDWARDTKTAAQAVAKRYGGAFGIGLEDEAEKSSRSS